MARPNCGTCEYVELKTLKTSGVEKYFCNALPPTGRFYPSTHPHHPCCIYYQPKPRK